MKSIQLVARRTLEPREMPMPPDPGPGEALVKLCAVGLCGSDMHWYLEGGIGGYRAVYPQVLGHEPAGKIVAIGKDVAGLSPGQKVALEPAITCGRCEFCLAGHHNNCMASLFMGSPQMPGLFREYAVVPARNVVAIPANMSFAQATVIEPLSVILHILELVEIRLGDTVAVLGAGPVGALTAMVARIAGASCIFMADKLPHRLRLAREMCADVCVNTNSESLLQAVLDHTGGRGVDIAFDAAASPETVNMGIAVARPGGRLVLIGIPVASEMPIDIMTAMFKELSIQTVKRSNHNAHAAIELLESGRISDKLITHRLPLAQTPAAFETLAHYADGVGKVVIEIP